MVKMLLNVFSGGKNEIIIKTICKSPLLEAKLDFLAMGKHGIRTSLLFPLFWFGWFVCLYKGLKVFLL